MTIERKLERTMIADKLVNRWTVIDANPLGPLLAKVGEQLAHDVLTVCTVPPLSRVVVRFGKYEWIVGSQVLHGTHPDLEGDIGGPVISMHLGEFDPERKVWLVWAPDGRARGMLPWGLLEDPKNYIQPSTFGTSCWVIALLVILAYCHTPAGVVSLRHKTNDRLTAKDEADGVVAYSTLTIGARDLDLALAHQERNASRLPPMLHWVRRHERRVGEATIIIPQHLRGDPGRGFHFKDYRLGG